MKMEYLFVLVATLYISQIVFTYWGNSPVDLFKWGIKNPLLVFKGLALENCAFWFCLGVVLTPVSPVLFFIGLVVSVWLIISSGVNVQGPEPQKVRLEN
jgi:hypothetical protein